MRTARVWVGAVVALFGVLSLVWAVVMPAVAVLFSAGSELLSWSRLGPWMLVRAGVGAVALVGGVVLAVWPGKRRDESRARSVGLSTRSS